MGKYEPTTGPNKDVRFILSSKAKIHLTYMGAAELQDLVKLGQYVTTERRAENLKVILLKLGLTVEEGHKMRDQKVIKVDAGSPQ